MLVDQYIQLDHVGGAVFVYVVVHAGVALVRALEFVIEIDDDLGEWESYR